MTSLKELLESLNVDSLRGISDFWGLSSPETAKAGDLAEFLYPRLQSPRYARAALERLNQSERLVVTFAAAHGGCLDSEELVRRCSGANGRSATPDTLARLVEKGFLYVLSGKNPLHVMPDALLRAVSLPPHWRGYLGAHLAAMPPDEFAHFYRGLAGRAVEKSPARARWHARLLLLEPESLQRYLDSLPPEEADIFLKLCRRGGSALYRDLLDLESSKHFDHARCEHLNSLVAGRGLVYVAAEGNNKYGNLLTVPRDLWQIVDSGFQPDTRSAAELDAVASTDDGEAPKQVRDNSHLLLRDIVLFGSSACAAGFRKLSQGKMGRKDFQRLPSVLSDGRPGNYLAFLAAYLVDCGHLVDVRGRWKLADKFGETLQEASRLYEELLNWWMSTQSWDDSQVDEIAEANGRTRSRIDPIQLRRAVVERIASLPPGRWSQIASFLDEVLPVIEAESVRRTDATRSAAARKALSGNVSGMILGPLHWLGLVEIGGSPQHVEGADSDDEEKPARKGAARRTSPPPAADETRSFRLSQLGSAVLQRAEFHGPEAIAAGAGAAMPFKYDARWVIVQPNHEIMAPPDLNLRLLFELIECCDVRTLDVMTIVEMSRDSLRRGLDRGRTGDAVINLLREMSRTGVPETIEHLVGETMVRHGEALVGHAGGYIQVDDPVIMEEIRSNPRLVKQIKDLASPTVAILAPDTNPEKVARELRSMGLLPRLQSDTVHKSSGDSYHLTLTAEEMLHTLAAVRLLGLVEEELDKDISAGHSKVLTRKLIPDGAHLGDFKRILDTTCRSYERDFKDALAARVDRVEDKYKTKVSRLVGRGMTGRSLSKYHYNGPNPAVERTDIVSLLKFAADHELDTEVQYLRKNDRESKLTLQPKSFEGGRLYAHCSETETDGMYAVERILRARLV